MNKKIKLSIGIIIFIFVAFLYAHIAKTVMIYDKEVDTSQYGSTGALVDMEIQQEFVCKENKLDGIRIKCSLLGNPENTSLGYLLEDLDDNKIVAKGNVDASNAKVTKMFEIRFDTIQNTKNKHYRFTVNPNGENDNSALSLAFQKKTEKGTKMFLNKEKIEGTLILKTVTDRFDVETFVVVLLFGAYIAFFFNFLYKMFKQ